MTLPAFLFGMLIATVYGSAFHLFRGGGFGRLILDIIFSWVGFWCGHFLASRADWIFWSIGPLNLGMATVGSIIGIILGYWITNFKKMKKV